MDIRHLRCFVAVAQHLHFGRAAQQLHMSQPPLSKRIAALELELGTLLFHRTKRSVALTATGRTLLAKARAAIAAFDAVAAAVKPRSKGASQIRIAFPSDTSPEVLLELVKTMSPNDPEIDLIEATTAEQQELLRAGDLDVGVLRHPYESQGLWSSPPLRQTLGVVLPRSHPLARRKALELRELRTNTLIMFPRSIAPGLYDELIGTCRVQGYKPKRIMYGYGVRMVAGLIVAESAITFRPAHFVVPGPVGQTPDLTWRPLAGEPLQWWTSVVCRRNDPDQRTRTAVQVIVQALQRHDHWIPGLRESRTGMRGSKPSGAMAAEKSGAPRPAARSRRIRST